MHQTDNQLDLNLFRVLEAIHAHGGTSGAARALHLTQPAVSHALARLRVAFEDPLFVRQGNRMVATERTRSVIADVKKHLQGLYAAVNEREEFRPERLQVEVRIGLRDALESVTLPTLSKRLAKEAPGVRVFGLRVPMERFESELSAGRLDLAIDREVATTKQIRSVRLVSEPWAVVAQRDTKKLTMREYLAHKHVTVTQMEGFEPLDLVLAKHGFSRNVALRCQHYFAACEVVVATGWLLSMPRTYALRMAQVMPLSVLPLPYATPPIDILMYWHAARDDDPAHVWLRRLILESGLEGAGLMNSKR
jgi:DNA-binding transcriptional LysR family regulator